MTQLLAERRPLERDAVTAILDWLKKQPGCYARKAHGSGYSSGWPDIVGCWHGRMFVLEVKRAGDPHKLTANQQAALRQWRSAGAVAEVVHSLDETKAVLAKLVETEPLPHREPAVSAETTIGDPPHVNKAGNRTRGVRA